MFHSKVNVDGFEQGKIVDVLSKDVDIVARCQGGSNAGHTIKVLIVFIDISSVDLI